MDKQAYEGGGTASARGDAPGSGAGLPQVAPGACSAAAVGCRATLDSDDETHCGGGAERAVLNEHEAWAAASPGSRAEGMVGGGASEDSTRRLLPRRPSLVDGRGTTRTPGGEAPHTASSARGGGAQATPSVSKPQAMPSVSKLCPSRAGGASWRRSLSGGGNPIGEAAPGSSIGENDSNCALDMLGMLSRRTSLGSMASRCDERAADTGRATVIAGAAHAGSSLGRTRLLDHRTRSMAAGYSAPACSELPLNTPGLLRTTARQHSAQGQATRPPA